MKNAVQIVCASRMLIITLRPRIDHPAVMLVCILHIIQMHTFRAQFVFVEQQMFNERTATTLTTAAENKVIAMFSNRY